MQDFQRLLVWRKAHALALNVDRATQGFSRSGYAGLKSQLTRAADGTPANIVEGCGAATQREFGRFLDIAIKSTSETQYHLISAHDRGLISDDDWRSLTNEATQIRRMLYALRKKVLGPRPVGVLSH